MIVFLFVFFGVCAVAYAAAVRFEKRFVDRLSVMNSVHRAFVRRVNEPRPMALTRP